MRRFKSAGHAQRFLSAFGIITSHFRPGRHLGTVGAYRQMMKRRLAVWEEVVVGALSLKNRGLSLQQAREHGAIFRLKSCHEVKLTMPIADMCH
jgi:hypothetical protein